jgi:glycosyltransferase involved in cell wall biosynthesis
MPMRFLILTQYYPPEVGAPQVRLAATARELVRTGHEVEVVTALPNYPEGRIHETYRGKPALSEEVDGVRVRRTWMLPAQGRGWRRLLSYASFSFTSVAGLLASKRPDVVFVESPPPLLAIPAWAMARVWDSTLVLNVSDLWPDSAVALKAASDGYMLRAAEWLEAWSYRQADFVNTVTEEWRSTLVDVKHVPPRKVLMLPNGVDVDVFKPLPRDAALADKLGVANRTVVVNAGTLGYAAGLGVLLGAAELLKDRPITFVLAGDGSERQRLERSAKEGQLDNVLFIGAQPPESVARLYSIASMAVVTLLERPLFVGMRPARLLAAMACGKPVVLSAGGSAADLVRESESGVVTPAEDPALLADAVMTMAGAPDTAATMGLNARRFVEEHYTWPALVTAWLETFTSRLASN